MWEGQVNDLPAGPWPSGFSLRTSLFSLVIRLAEKAQGSAHVQQNNTIACFYFFLMFHSQRMSCVFLSLDKVRTLLLWNQSSSSKYRLGECGLALPSLASQHQGCPSITIPYCVDSGWVFLQAMLKRIKGAAKLDLRFSPVRPSPSTAPSEAHHNAGEITHWGYRRHHLKIQHGGLQCPVCHVTGRDIQIVVTGKELSAFWKFRAACKYHFVIYFMFLNKRVMQKRKTKSDKLVGIWTCCSLWLEQKAILLSRIHLVLQCWIQRLDFCLAVHQIWEVKEAEGCTRNIFTLL